MSVCRACLRPYCERVTSYSTSFHPLSDYICIYVFIYVYIYMGICLSVYICVCVCVYIERVCVRVVRASPHTRPPSTP